MRAMGDASSVGDCGFHALKARMRCLFVLLLSLTSCVAAISSYARATAGRIGCPAADIEIRDTEDDQPGPRSWVALCGGKMYACSSNGDLREAGSRVVCAEHGGGQERGDEHELGEDHED
jgi:hypothetical protein